MSFKILHTERERRERNYGELHFEAVLGLGKRARHDACQRDEHNTDTDAGNMNTHMHRRRHQVQAQYRNKQMQGAISHTECKRSKVTMERRRTSIIDKNVQWDAELLELRGEGSHGSKGCQVQLHEPHFVAACVAHERNLFSLKKKNKGDKHT
jgi:hypothetical protein